MGALSRRGKSLPWPWYVHTRTPDIRTPDIQHVTSSRPFYLYEPHNDHCPTTMNEPDNQPVVAHHARVHHSNQCTSTMYTISCTP